MFKNKILYFSLTEGDILGISWSECYQPVEPDKFFIVQGWPVHAG